MDGRDTSSNRYLFDWDESDVHQWLSSLGYPQYERQIREHKIQGDTLCVLDSEGLKSFGIATVGQRLSILKSLYYLKLAHNIPLDEDAYVPPSEASSPAESISIQELHSAVKDQAQRLRSLEEENRTLTNVMVSFLDEIVGLRLSIGFPDDTSNKVRQQIPYLRSDAQYVNRSVLPSMSDISNQTPSSDPSASAYATPLSTSQETPDHSNNMKVSLDDPTWKVLPAALKKHHIKNDDWQNYVMFISYGPSGNRTKRRLELDEKPLCLFKKLKDAKKNPAFLLKNMKDLRSPAPDSSHTLHLPSTISQEAPSPGLSQSRQHLFTPTIPHTPGSQID